VKRPTLSEIGRFLLIVFGVLLIAKLGRSALFDGPREAVGGGDVTVAIGVAVAVTGGWLRRSRRVT
jgi:hypothetical protein